MKTVRRTMAREGNGRAWFLYLQLEKVLENGKSL